MPANRERKYRQIIDYIEDQVGADINRDLIKVAIAAQDSPSTLGTDIEQIGGTDQSGGDLIAALQSVSADDELRLRLFAEDANGNLGEIQGEELGASLGGSETAVVTKLAEVLETVGNTEARVSLYAEDDAGNLNEVQADELDAAVNGTETAVMTVLARALEEVGNTELRARLHDSAGTQIDPLNQDALQAVANDELRSRIHDSSGAQLDPLNQDALQTVGNDELRMRLFADDDAGNTAQLQAEEIGTPLGGAETALITFLSSALQDVGRDEIRSRLHDSSGAQINPDQSPDYPATVREQDLIGTGDLTIGPVSVARSEAVIIAANSEDGNSWSASVTWQDGSGNVTQNESASDIGLNSVTDDFARLVRKGPQVAVTFTDSSSGAANNINAYADAHR